MNAALTAFLEHARSRGLDLATIRMILLSAGWKEKDVAKAHAEHSLALPVPARDDCYGIDFRQENSIRWFFLTHGKCFRFDYMLNAFYEDNTWTSGQWARLPVNTAMYLDAKTYVGDYGPTGKIYHWSEDYQSDDGADIRVYRRFLVPLTPTGNRARVNRVQFRVKRGVASTSTARPLFMVRYRMDGDSWSNTYNFDLGQKGDWDPYIDILNVGVGRELEMELTGTDAVAWLVTHCNVTARPWAS